VSEALHLARLPELFAAIADRGAAMISATRAQETRFRTISNTCAAPAESGY
jgi:hypothetical protein